MKLKSLFTCFKCRDKYERISIILGSLCFLPTFFIALFLLGLYYSFLAISLLVVTQTMWLLSYSFGFMSLEIENKKLKEQLKKE